MHDPTAAAKGATETPGGGFGDMLKGAINSLNQTAKASDAQTQAMAAGKANIVDVVTAVAETEVDRRTRVGARSRYPELRRNHEDADLRLVGNVRT